MATTAPRSTTTGRDRGSGPGPGGTRLAELLWYRSLTGAARPYVAHARADRSLTYLDLRQASRRWPALLGDLGVAPGGTVGIAVADPVDFATVFLSVIAAGRVAAPLDPGAPAREQVAACRRVGPVLVVADAPAPPGVPCEWLALPAGSFELAGAEGGPVPGAAPPAGPGGVLLSTSGTTGAPKRILLTEDRLLHTAGCVAAHHQLSAVDRGFNPLPLFHVNAEVVGLLATLVAGSSLVLDDRFHRTGFWELLAERQVTWVNAVPAIVSRLVPLAPGEAVPDGVRFVRSASAPLPPAVAARFEAATGLPVVETYGMTEAASQITANPLAGPRKPGSVGRPVGVELRVVPPGGDPAGPGAASATGPDPAPDPAVTGMVGRVEIRGPGVITAYAGAGYEERVGPGGWLDTGDLGRLDGDGYLYLVGRVDDVINRGGEKIFPREVEEVVLADPEVAAAAVVGWDHHELGRVPVAYLVLRGVAREADRGRAEAIVARVRERCARSLSRAKRPAAYHVVGRLPAGATGKVRRSLVDPHAAIYSLLVG